MCDVSKLRDMLEFGKQLSFNIIRCLIYTITDVNQMCLNICNETILLSYLEIRRHKKYDQNIIKFYMIRQ